ncbi:hypothetical protein [Saccharothrix sp. ST-888]|uniref:hypothetical protein n=1 Tax=Saccharothrix sp. ST-888 TaxID=1427391 RepID=UPI00069760B2|nr:hypothetical protein [Saccharothrix sp. ST-888]
MSMEVALLESRTLRRNLSGRTEALDKVKALALLPDGLHVTTRMVADYFEVGERALNSVIQRHREELESNGFTVLWGSDLQTFVSFNLKLTKLKQRRLAVFPRRAVLNVAMLLQDSEVARSVRRSLLDLVDLVDLAADRPEAPCAESGGCWCSRVVERVTEQAADRAVERVVGQIAERFHERVAAVEQRVAGCEGMVLADRELLGAMSVRLCQVGEDVGELRLDLAELRSGLGRLGARPPGRPRTGRRRP